jgi:hypothetical protein
MDSGPEQTLVYSDPGKDQRGKRKSRFPLSFIFSALQAPNMAARPCAAGNANKSAFPEGRSIQELGQGSSV